MYVTNAIGEVFSITQEHINYAESYQYPQEHKNAFEVFLWDMFGDTYSDIKIENRMVFFYDSHSDISNYLVIGQNMDECLKKQAHGMGVTPMEVVIGDDGVTYKNIMIVEDIDVTNPK